MGTKYPAMKPNVCVNITESRIRAGSEESRIPPPPDKSNDVEVVVAAAALFNPILIIPELFDTTPPHISDTSSLDRITSMVATAGGRLVMEEDSVLEEEEDADDNDE